ncbi:MAG: hypothetical protein KGL98_00300 [Gammaproteobacteria bacterium]|nr:hypothetical protein [Gammaproteobacteria bacterium]MDE2459666.1 hypothetical protein [Gammaproteobacteria bacterium]
MLRAPRQLCLLMFALLLTACGGGSSQVTPPTITLVTPIATTIAAGSSLQLSAVVANSSNTTVLWYVNAIPGGNSAVGTITPQGLYTAPDMPTANGTVVISASPQAYPAAVTSVTIGITFSNASLNGNFVFTLNGTQSASPWAAVGSFTAGNGQIGSGVEDINGPSGVSTALPFSGSYFIDASGIGIATFTSSQGSVNLSFTLNTQGQAVVMRTDSGTTASGNFYAQQSTALTLTNLNAAYVFSFSGNASGKSLNAIGTFVTNGTNTLTYAEEDLNLGGSTANQPFSGSYSIGSGARGTASFTDSTGTRSYSFYLVSPNQLQFIETDSTGNLSGTAFQQQSVTSTSTLAGGYVFYAAGSNGTSAYGIAGGFATSTTVGGTINAGTSDINLAGTLASNSTLTGSFIYGTSGRGTITLNGASGANNYVYYEITPTSAFLLSSDPGINASGLLFLQTGGFSTVALSGNYTLSLASPAGATPTLSMGLLTLNGIGAIAGFENTNDNGTASGQLSVTGTYAVTASSTNTSTRGLMTLTTNGGTSTNFAFYPISSGSLILLGAGPSPVSGLMVSQY